MKMLSNLINSQLIHLLFLLSWRDKSYTYKLSLKNMVTNTITPQIIFPFNLKEKYFLLTNLLFVYSAVDINQVWLDCTCLTFVRGTSLNKEQQP